MCNFISLELTFEFMLKGTFPMIISSKVNILFIHFLSVDDSKLQETTAILGTQNILSDYRINALF